MKYILLMLLYTYINTYQYAHNLHSCLMHMSLLGSLLNINIFLNAHSPYITYVAVKIDIYDLFFNE